MIYICSMLIDRLPLNNVAMSLWPYQKHERCIFLFHCIDKIGDNDQYRTHQAGNCGVVGPSAGTRTSRTTTGHRNSNSNK